METQRRLALRRILIVLDGLAIIVAMIAAMAIHTALRHQFSGFKSPPALEQYLLLAYFTVPMWLSIAAILGLYRQLERPPHPLKLLRSLLKLHFFGLLGLALLIYMTQIYMNRSVVALFVVLTFLLMLGGRLLLQIWLRHDFRRGHGQQRVLLVADSAASVATVASAMAATVYPPRLIGCLRHEHSADDLDGWNLPILGSPSSISRVLHDNAVDIVLVSCSRDVTLDMESLLVACDEVGVPLRCHVRVDHGGKHAVRIAEDFGIPAIEFESRKRPYGKLLAKRCLDVAVSGAGLLLLLPVLLLTAFAIRISMGKPVFLRQERIGYNGRRFRMYKFRTMVRDADQVKEQLQTLNEVDGPAFKIRSDPRVTPLGRLLRRASVDELPQLLNVLLGEMSLVGPRPLIVSEQQSISGPRRRRLSMKPGMTGLWQVSGRSNLTFDDWMTLDLQYVDNWSLGLDFELLIETVPAVLTGRGAV